MRSEDPEDPYVDPEDPYADPEDPYADPKDPYAGTGCSYTVCGYLRTHLTIKLLTVNYAIICWMNPDITHLLVLI